ncbi:ArnT family glycosyltransferase [Variovorax ginsengisoli]|uniref:Glycosyltransferase RgtA/B/C/D-like domain-containing protein n=1 Tax=Variovorax ginsengisoli TaxID=363844 RepID=A0ABT9S1P5_9BURK|nr:hypothetical protein [Variovorax ginsengisoli]MDP9898274.1 hypothetical protein [Variovorax ginsengisoli]
MLETLTHGIGHYAALASVLLACWGLGNLLMRAVPAGGELPQGLRHPMAIAIGLCVAVCGLQWLAIGGALRRGPVLALIAIGWITAALQAWRLFKLRAQGPAAKKRPPLLPAERCALILLALALASTLLAPLSPPLQWDELMYHLPHAREWALSGRLQVNEWLRYRWFPYNYDLLYAAALLFGNDILTHLLHASAGWLTAWMVYQLGVAHLSRVGGCLAAMIWVVLSVSEYDRAYVDMGATLLVLTGCIAFAQWRATRLRFWLAACGFSLGVAAGTKYQVLAILPFFAVALAWQDRRPDTWLLTIVSLVLPCGYWYLRNALATGDPFAPLGGRLFGFSDWNLSDYRGQFEDLHNAAGLPHWLLWPALLAPFIPALRRSPAARGAMYFCAWMLVVWVASSPYPRYLMTAFPLLALLAAAAWIQVSQRLFQPIDMPRFERAQRWIGALAILLVAVAALVSTVKYAKRVALTPSAREALLAQRLKSYGMWQYLKTHPAGKTYQMGLEGSLYYAPRPIWGDVFGPWRYRDFATLPPEALHRALAAQGFDALVVDTGRMPDTVAAPDFERWFTPVYADHGIHLYRLQTTALP